MDIQIKDCFTYVSTEFIDTQQYFSIDYIFHDYNEDDERSLICCIIN